MHDWQDRWESFNQSLRAGATSAEAERVRVEELDNHVRRVVAQRERAGRERETLTAADVTARIAEVEREEATARAARRRCAAAHGGTGRRSFRPSGNGERELAESAQAARREAARDRGSHRVARGAAARRAWTGERHRWSSGSRRAGSPGDRVSRSSSRSMPGWERAVETVLGAYLEAVCVDSIDDVAGLLE